MVSLSIEMWRGFERDIPMFGMHINLNYEISGADALVLAGERKRKCYSPANYDRACTNLIVHIKAELDEKIITLRFYNFCSFHSTLLYNNCILLHLCVGRVRWV